MPDFENTKRKIFNTFNRNNANDSEIKNKSKLDKVLKTKDQLDKAPQVIYDSGFVVANSGSNSDFTPNQNDIVYRGLSYSFSPELTLPENLIPFVDVSLSVKGVPDKTIEVFKAIDTQSADDYIKIAGGGTTLWEGELFDQDTNDPIPTDFDKTLSFANGGNNVPASNLKKLWRISIEWTDSSSGTRVRIRHGALITVQQNTILGAGCAGDEFDLLFCNPGTSIPSGGENLMEFHNVTNSGVDCTFSKDEFRSEVNPSPPPPCNSETTRINGIRTSIAWSDLTLIQVLDDTNTIVEKLVGDEWVGTSEFSAGFPSRVSITGDDTIHDVCVIPRETDSVLYDFVFYSSSRRHLLELTTGAFVELTNLPQTAFYSSITLTRNPENIRTNPQESNNSIFLNRNESWFRISKTTDEDFDNPNGLKTYQLKLNGNFYYKGKAKTTNISRNYRVQSDTYLFNGTIYELDTSSQSTVSVPLYIVEDEDIQVRLRLTINHPLYYDNTIRVSKT